MAKSFDSNRADVLVFARNSAYDGVGARIDQAKVLFAFRRWHPCLVRALAIGGDGGLADRSDVAL